MSSIEDLDQEIPVVDRRFRLLPTAGGRIRPRVDYPTARNWILGPDATDDSELRAVVLALEIDEMAVFAGWEITRRA